MKDKDKSREDDEVKVTDKRRFTPEGQAREAAGGDVSQGPTESGKETAAPKEKPTNGAEAPPEGVKQGRVKGEEKRHLPEMDFSTFVLSLATSAQVHLGVLPNPVTGKPEKDLQVAKQTIDILGMLEEKTKGNLTQEEARLLEHLLYDLRMMYVELSKSV